jgi:fumarate reductase subunit D
VFTLIIACLVFFLPIIYQKRTDKLILGFFSLLCLNFILREFNVGELDIPNILILIGSGIGRKLILAIGFFSMFCYALYNRTHYQNEIKIFIFSKKTILLGVAAILLFLGGFFEEAQQLPHHVYLEETSEWAGYVLILITAFIYAKKP